MTYNYKRILIILRYSVRYGFKWRWWKFLITGGLGSLLGLFQFGKNFLELDIKRSCYFGVVAILILYLIRVFLLFFIQSLKYYHEVYKNAKYGDAIIMLKDSFSELHHYRKTPGHQDEQFITAMVVLCNNLKIIYNKITKTECSVSIKVPLTDIRVDEKTILSNLTRDTDHSKSDTKLNRDTTKYKSIKHTLIGNTAFINTFNKVIKNEKHKYYLNNQVNETDNYDNTSKECYQDGILPYNSELVCPIVPYKIDKSKNYDCHGYICVDSTSRKAFVSKYDIAILEGVADGIYDVIYERNKFKNQQNEQERK